MNISYAKRFEELLLPAGHEVGLCRHDGPRPGKEILQRARRARRLLLRGGYDVEGMVSTTPGIGQAYLGAYKDKNNRWFDGGKTYKLTVPPNPPARQFWSIHDLRHLRPCWASTRRHRTPIISSRDEGLRKNADGSVDLYFGPTAPEGYEKNWLQTNPGKAWFAYSGSTARWSPTWIGAGNYRTSKWSVSVIERCPPLGSWRTSRHVRSQIGKRP